MAFDDPDGDEAHGDVLRWNNRAGQDIAAIPVERRDSAGDCVELGRAHFSGKKIRVGGGDRLARDDIGAFDGDPRQDEPATFDTPSRAVEHAQAQSVHRLRLVRLHAFTNLFFDAGRISRLGGLGIGCGRQQGRCKNRAHGNTRIKRSRLGQCQSARNSHT